MKSSDGAVLCAINAVPAPPRASASHAYSHGRASRVRTLEAHIRSLAATGDFRYSPSHRLSSFSPARGSYRGRRDSARRVRGGARDRRRAPARRRRGRRSSRWGNRRGRRRRNGDHTDDSPRRRLRSDGVRERRPGSHDRHLRRDDGRRRPRLRHRGVSVPYDPERDQSRARRDLDAERVCGERHLLRSAHAQVRRQRSRRVGRVLERRVGTRLELLQPRDEHHGARRAEHRCERERLSCREPVEALDAFDRERRSRSPTRRVALRHRRHGGNDRPQPRLGERYGRFWRRGYARDHRDGGDGSFGRMRIVW